MKLAKNYKLRRNILMDEYFVQDSKFLHKRDEWGFACKTVSTDFNSTQVDCGMIGCCVYICLLDLYTVLIFVDNMLYCLLCLLYH